MKKWKSDTCSWHAVLFDDDTLHLVAINSDNQQEEIYTPTVFNNDKPVEWISSDHESEAYVMPNGNLMLHRPTDDFYKTVYKKVMSRVFNKMYIVSGGVKDTDRLSSYHLLTMSMLDRIPPYHHTHRMFNTAIEVDTTGKHVSYDTCPGDNYWTTSVNTPLKDFRCRRVACINDQWIPLETNPFDGKCDDYIKTQGYEEKLGLHGAGWYDKDHLPPFRTAMFNHIHQWLKLDWDFSENQYASMEPDMQNDEIGIYSGKEFCSCNTKIGNIVLDGKQVVATLGEKVYRFGKADDQDLLDFARLCVDSSFAFKYAMMQKDADIAANAVAPGVIDDYKKEQVKSIITGFDAIVKAYEKLYNTTMPT